MKRGITIIGIGVVLVAAAWFILSRASVPPFAATPSQEEIKREIAAANYCTSKDDCVQVASQCPFSCHVFVNKNEASRIEGLITSFESNCAYGCVELKGHDCVNGRCEVSF